jgi:hypothetical protein
LDVVVYGEGVRKEEEEREGLEVHGDVDGAIELWS